MKPLATRDAFGAALVEVASNNERIVVLSCDLSGATRTRAFADKYPSRFFEFGIAEQNAISASAGFALEGYRPFISSFGAFISARYDQIRISCAYSNAGVVIVGTHAGLAVGKDGATQMGTEDLALMTAVPGMNVYQPADALEAKQIVAYLASIKELAYLRLSRSPLLSVLPENYQFEPGKIQCLSKGADCYLLATGDMVYYASLAVDLLAKKGVSAGLINVSTIKPIDRDGILAYASEVSSLITIEDHSIRGGLGSSVCEVLAESDLSTAVLRIGLDDCFGESGSVEDLYEKYRMSPKAVCRRIFNMPQIKSVSESLLGDIGIFSKKAESVFQQGKKLLVFGSGKGGRVLKSILAESGYEIAFFLDNNADLDGRHCGDTPIYTPNKLSDVLGDEYYIFVASVYYHEIKIQLKEMGFIEGDDFSNALNETLLKPYDELSDSLKKKEEELNELYLKKCYIRKDIKKLRIALCLSGQMRSFRYTYENLKKYILDPLEPDVFIHTWTLAGKTFKRPSMSGLHESCFAAGEPIWDEYENIEVTYDELERLYNPVTSVIETYNDTYSDQKDGIQRPLIMKELYPDYSGATIPMAYKIYACNELKKDFEKRENFKYDIVIRLRPDLKLKGYIPLEAFNPDSNLWWSTWPCLNPEVQVSDQLALGSSAVMDLYSSQFLALPKIWEDPIGDGKFANVMIGERIMRRHVSLLGINERPFELDSEIIR